MELRHLRVFLTLCEELHFGRTAARLHVAQSAVSRTLHDLETELDAQLVERSSRQVRLSEAGLAFLSYAQEAVQAVDRGMSAARALHGRGGRLKLRLLTAATAPRLPALLARFQRENPDTVLEIRDGTSARNLEALEASLCDVAMVSLAAARRLGPAYAKAPLASSELCVVVPRRHRLARQKSVPLSELRGERILGLQRDDEPEVRRRLDARLASLGTVPTEIELSVPQALLPLIAAGLGIAIVPAFAVPASDPKLRAIPLAGAVRGGVAAVWKQQRPSAATKKLVDLLHAAAAAD